MTQVNSDALSWKNLEPAAMRLTSCGYRQAMTRGEASHDLDSKGGNCTDQPRKRSTLTVGRKHSRKK